MSFSQGSLSFTSSVTGLTAGQSFRIMNLSRRRGGHADLPQPMCFCLTYFNDSRNQRQGIRFTFGNQCQNSLHIKVSTHMQLCGCAQGMCISDCEVHSLECK